MKKSRFAEKSEIAERFTTALVKELVKLGVPNAENAGAQVKIQAAFERCFDEVTDILKKRGEG